MEPIVAQLSDVKPPTPQNTWWVWSETATHYLLLSVPLVVLVSLSWAKWPDAVIDFGQQLYIAWRLAVGDVLHRDIAYHHGPLAANVNALVFRVFGPGLWVLVAVNALVAVAIFGAIHYLLRKGTSAWASTWAVSFGICVFAFAQYVAVGNYNYLTPYVHDATHGLLWALVMLVIIARKWFCFKTVAVREGRVSGLSTFWAGIALGMCFLTKAEIFLAAAVAAAVFVVYEYVKCLRTPAKWLRCVAVFVAGFATPPGVAFITYRQYLPWKAAARATAGPWPAVLGGEGASNVFYVDGMGMDAPFDNAWLMVVCSLWWLVVWGLAVGAGFLLRGMSRHSLIGVGVCIIALCTAWAAPIRWSDAARGVPLLLAGLLAVDVRTSIMQYRNSCPLESTTLVRVLINAFAVALTLKMFLNVRVYHYGFVLAMPGVLTVVAAALGKSVGHECASPRQIFITRAVILGILVACAGRHIQASQRMWAQKTYSVGQGRDWFLAGPDGEIVEKARVAIPSILDKGDDVAVMPDGVMLAYLMKRKMGVPFLYFMPNDLAIYGEERIAESFEECAPQAVAIVHKDTSEFGKKFFGQDYAREIATRVVERYRARLCIGALPMENDQFGILLLTKRKPGREPTPAGEIR